MIEAVGVGAVVVFAYAVGWVNGYGRGARTEAAWWLANATLAVKVRYLGDRRDGGRR